MSLRSSALAAHVALLAASLGWCFEQDGRPALVLGTALVLATLLPVGRAIWRGTRTALQRSALVVVLYVGIASLEVVATRRAAWLPIVALYSALALLALILALARRAPRRGSA